jgi:hypothetical protein
VTAPFAARRVWLAATGAPIALAIAVVGAVIAALNADPADFGVVGFSIGGLPAACAMAWITRAAWRANVRRALLRKALHAALSAQGEPAHDIESDSFPDIPFCIGGGRIYCANGMEIVIQPLDGVVWCYVENFVMRPWMQLVIWNSGASAIVLPIRKGYVDRALERMRQAAPWLPVGYNTAMKETWNADHREFLALVDACRQSGRRFDASWAGQGFARVASPLRKRNPFDSFERTKNQRELERLTRRWDQEAGTSPRTPPSTIPKA